MIDSMDTSGNYRLRSCQWTGPWEAGMEGRQLDMTEAIQDAKDAEIRDLREALVAMIEAALVAQRLRYSQTRQLQIEQALNLVGDVS
jgi:hypothetical protein